MIEISISNYVNSYFKKFVFKKLHLFTFDFYQVIVDSGFTLVNYHAIEILRSNYFNSYFKKNCFYFLSYLFFPKE